MPDSEFTRCAAMHRLLRHLCVCLKSTDTAPLSFCATTSAPIAAGSHLWADSRLADVQTAESCVLGSEQSSLEQSAREQKLPQHMYVLNLHTGVVYGYASFREGGG